MMSDPRTNIEVEDVLSSIRRLISQDAAVSQSPIPHRSAAEEAGAQTLLLTPAQRIGEQDGPDEGGDISDELSRLETTIAEMEAAVAESQVVFEPEQGDPFMPDEADPLKELPETFDEARFDPEEQAPDDAPVVFEDRQPEEDAVAQMPDRAAFTDDGLPPLEEADLVDEQAETGADPDLQDEAWAQTTSDDWAEDLRDEAEGAIESLAIGAAVEELRHLSLEDAQEASSLSDARMSSYDEMRAEMALEEALDMELEQDAEAPEDLPFDADDLRGMVAMMIREELQGTLGERITRNVRKLVRREIQRALLSRDME